MSFTSKTALFLSFFFFPLFLNPAPNANLSRAAERGGWTSSRNNSVPRIIKTSLAPNVYVGKPVLTSD